MRILFFILAFILFLSGCNEKKQFNSPPIIESLKIQDASLEQHIAITGHVIEPDNDSLTYQWKFTKKPLHSKSFIADPNKLSTSFFADQRGLYELQLQVSDGQAFVKKNIQTEIINLAPKIKITNEKRIANPSEKIRIPFTIIDERPKDIVYKVQSSNQNLVKNANFVIIGHESPYFLDFTTEPLNTGQTNIKIIAQDIHNTTSSIEISLLVVNKLNAKANHYINPHSITLSGDHAMVSSYNNHPPQYKHSSYIFKQENNQHWIHQAKFSNKTFFLGGSMSKDYIIFGDSSRNTAYIFQNIAGSWIKKDTLLSSDAPNIGSFGQVVTISNNHAIVSAPNKNNGRGAVYVFHKKDNKWIQQAKLTSDNPKKSKNFGKRLAISNNHLMIGADDKIIFIFRNINNIWTQVFKFSDKSIANFGHSIDISDHHAIVGAPSTHFSRIRGKVYVFQRKENTWTKQSELVPTDIDRYFSGRFFGHSVAISKNYAIASSFESNDQSVYIFHHKNNNWRQSSKLIRSNRSRRISFGNHITIDNDNNNLGVIGSEIYIIPPKLWQIQ